MSVVISAGSIPLGLDQVGPEAYGDYSNDYDHDAVTREYREILEAKLQESLPTAYIVGDRIWCLDTDRDTLDKLEAAAEDGDDWVRDAAGSIDIGSIMEDHDQSIVELINLTAHPVVVAEGPMWGTYAPSGTEARVVTREVEDDVIGYTGIPVKEYTNDVEGLPAPKRGTAYAVSALTALAATDRTDLLVPGEPIRDETGRIVGCKHLVRVRHA